MSEKVHVVRRPARRHGGLPSRNRGCPLTRNRSVWCYGACSPVAGRGLCGRIAPHALVGRTQLAIAASREGEEESSFDPTELVAPELWCRSGAW